MCLQGDVRMAMCEMSQGRKSHVLQRSNPDNSILDPGMGGRGGVVRGGTVQCLVYQSYSEQFSYLLYSGTFRRADLTLRSLSETKSLESRHLRHKAPFLSILLSFSTEIQICFHPAFKENCIILELSRNYGKS